MSADSTTTFSVLAFIGAATLLVCLIGAWGIYQDVTSLWLELDTEMDAFRALTDDMWHSMLAMGAGTSANRERRQVFFGSVVFVLS